MCRRINITLQEDVSNAFDSYLGKKRLRRSTKIESMIRDLLIREGIPIETTERNKDGWNAGRWCGEIEDMPLK